MKTKNNTEPDKASSFDTGKLYDFSQPPTPADDDAFQAYYRMRRISKQLKQPDLMPDGRVMTEAEVVAVLEQAPKKNAVAMGSITTAGTEDNEGGSVAPEVA